jgi:hypothetical protein
VDRIAEERPEIRGFAPLASASPERTAKIDAIIGCSSSRNCIGPVTRAAMSWDTW